MDNVPRLVLTNRYTHPVGSVKLSTAPGTDGTGAPSLDLRAPLRGAYLNRAEAIALRAVLDAFIAATEA